MTTIANVLAPAPVMRLYDNDGELAVGAAVYTYIAGTSTLVATFTDSTGDTANTNPVIANSRGEVSIWISPSQAYKFVALDADGNLLWSKDNIVSAQSSPIVSVLDYGATGGGVVNDTEAFVRAIEAVPNGGMIYVPQGIYALEAALGSGNSTAITIPSNVRIVGACQVAAKLIPKSNGVSISRILGMNGGIENLGFYNLDGRTSVSAIRLAPSDESSVLIHSDIEFNRVNNISIRDMAESITLRPGPNVSGQDSYLYYNTISNVDIRNSTRGVWLKTASNGGAGANGNTFIAVRCGETGMNTGIQIDLGSENSFHGCALEGIQTGSSPSATPTGLIIATGTGSSTANNSFHALRVEGCTLDINLNSNTTTQFYGLMNTGTITGTPSVLINDQGIAYHAQSGTGASRLSVNFPNNGDGIRFGNNAATTANTFYSVNLSGGGGPTGYLEFLYLQNQPVFTWGGTGSAYAGDLRLSNPLSNRSLFLGTQGSDRVTIDPSGNMWPATDNIYSLGKSGNRWTEVWAVNGTIQTSDENKKQQITCIDNKVLRAWANINYKQYKFTESVDKKGHRARYHIGLLAQDIERAFGAEGLDPFAYGLIYKDDAGVYGVNYSEVLSLECSYLRSLRA